MSLSLDKNDWFVNPGDSTDNNLVTPLIDGVALFSEISTYLDNLVQYDFCFFAAWEITPDFRLTQGAADSITDKFVRASDVGAYIRILLFANWDAKWDAHMDLKKQVEERPQQPIQLLMDRIHHGYGSHHQKFCIFGKKDPNNLEYTMTAFCGGIDPANQRFDDTTHRPTGDSIAYHVGWHDVHAKIEGPASEQLLKTFLDRWNDRDLPATSEKYHTDIDEIGDLPPKLPALQGNTHQVEVLHTYPCTATNLLGQHLGYTFATNNGIQTIRQAYIKAISQAQHYIYIENQYFSETQIVQALRDRLDNSDVKVIVVTPYYMDAGYDNLRLDLWNEFKQSPNFANFHLCDLRHPGAGYDPHAILYPDYLYREPIYVHVKLMIIDDVYALIGSANLNNRSMELDSELAIAVLDTQTEEDQNLGDSVCKFARDLRISLFREHFQLPNWGTTANERSIDYGISEFVAKINDPVGGVTVTPPSRVYKHNPENILISPGRRNLLKVAEKSAKCQF